MPATLSACAPLLAEMDQEAVATRRLLDRLPESQLGWRPHAKSQTLGQLAMHVASTPSIVPGLLAKDTFDGTNAKFDPAQPKTVAEVRAKFEDSLAGARSTLGSWSERDLSTVWRFQRDGKDVMSLPRAAAVRSLVLNHHVHHRGQLTVYLRLLGVPLPAVYGPSADENPFAAR